MIQEPIRSKKQTLAAKYWICFGYDVRQPLACAAKFRRNGYTSSITSLGEATLIAMPLSASWSSTSWKSKLRRDLARDRARPLGWREEERQSDKIPAWPRTGKGQGQSLDSRRRGRWCQTFLSFPVRCPSGRSCRCPWFRRSAQAVRSAGERERRVRMQRVNAPGSGTCQAGWMTQ